MSRKICNVRRRTIRAAFTLIELLLVLVILGVLAGVIVPKLAGQGEKSRIKATMASVSSLKTALNHFELDAGRYPTNDEGLNVLIQRPNSSDVKEWHGPYLDGSSLKDSWGNPFVYQNPGTHNPDGFDVYSWGADQREGTADDIGNWEAAK
jgi:general secretion pathway protein G